MTSVVSAKNGSIVAVTGAGIRHMSDSLIAFQPALEEPSNMVPSAKISSSIIETSNVTCCHLPRGSVKRRSTYLTSLSLIDLRTSLAVFMVSPLVVGWAACGRRLLDSRQYNSGVLNTISESASKIDTAAAPEADSGRHREISRRCGLDRIQPGLAGADADCLFDVGHEG